MYAVIELQTSADGTLASIVQQAATLNEANSIYHTILGAAAISRVPIHSCTLLDADGMQIKCETYHHDEHSDN